MDVMQDFDADAEILSAILHWKVVSEKRNNTNSATIDTIVCVETLYTLQIK